MRTARHSVVAMVCLLLLCAGAPGAHAQELVDAPVPAQAPPQVPAPEDGPAPLPVPVPAQAADPAGTSDPADPATAPGPAPAPSEPAAAPSEQAPTQPDAAQPPAATAGERPFSPAEFRNNAWNSVWLLTLVTAAPSVLLLVLPGLVVGAIWAVVGALVGGAAWTNAHQPTSLLVPLLAVVALFTALGGAGVTALTVLLVPLAYVAWRVGVLVFLPLPGETQDLMARTRRGLWFVGLDALVHGVVMAGAAVAGAVLGGALGVGLVLGSVCFPFTICFPYCLPWPQVVARGDGTALANFTGVPLLMALTGAGLCLGGVAAAQGVTPLLALWPPVRARRAAAPEPGLEDAPDSGDLELHDGSPPSNRLVTPAEEP